MYLNEFELRNRLSAEIAKNAHLHSQLERAEYDKKMLQNKIDSLNDKVYDLQQATLDYFKAICDLEEEYQNHLYRLEKEKRELLEIIESIRKRRRGT